MAGLYEVEIEPEVRSWLAGLDHRDFGRVDFLVGLLAEHAEDLGEPYARTAEVARALHAQKICEAGHGPAHQVFDREVN
jgi:hypothetical protein